MKYVVRCALPFAVLLALVGYASVTPDPVSGAEMRFLALWALAVLTPLIWLAEGAQALARARWPSTALACASVVLVLVAWTVPIASTRAAVFGVLLTSTALLVLVWRASVWKSAEVEISFLQVLLVAFVLQALLRPGLLLPAALSPHRWIDFVLPTLLGALAVTIVARHGGSKEWLFGAFLVVVLAGGWTFALVASLAVVLALALQRPSKGERPRFRMSPLLVASVLLAGALLLEVLAARQGGMVDSVRSWGVALASTLWLLLPLIVLGRFHVATLWRRWLVAVLLAFLAWRWLEEPGALALPLLWLMLERPVDEVPRTRIPWQLRQAVIVGIFVLAILLSGYPWLRPAALQSPPHVLVMDAAKGLSLGVTTPVLEAQTDLTQSSPAWRALVIEPGASRHLIVDSSLANSLELPAGAPVAEVFADGQRLGSLRVGVETGEWAARRADVSALGVEAPAPFRGRLTASGTFFAQSYRSRWALPAGGAIRQLEVRRAAELPEETVLSLLRVELQP